MVCRHSAHDPNCSRNGGGYVRELAQDQERKIKALETELANASPKPDDYEIEQVQRVGAHLVVRAKYPSCKRCAFEGSKVMVFLNVTEMDAILWREVDPHFRAPSANLSPKVAPSPAARFPATEEGWKDALGYAAGKRGNITRGE